MGDGSGWWKPTARIVFLFLAAAEPGVGVEDEEEEGEAGEEPVRRGRSG